MRRFVVVVSSNQLKQEIVWTRDEKGRENISKEKREPDPRYEEFVEERETENERCPSQ